MHHHPVYYYYTKNIILIIAINHSKSLLLYLNVFWLYKYIVCHFHYSINLVSSCHIQQILPCMLKIQKLGLLFATKIFYVFFLFLNMTLTFLLEAPYITQFTVYNLQTFLCCFLGSRKRWNMERWRLHVSSRWRAESASAEVCSGGHNRRRTKSFFLWIGSMSIIIIPVICWFVCTVSAISVDHWQ